VQINKKVDADQPSSEVFLRLDAFEKAKYPKFFAIRHRVLEERFAKKQRQQRS